MSEPDWPAAETRLVAVANPAVSMDEFAPDELIYRQSVPPLVATRSLPMLSQGTNQVLRAASASLGALAEATASSGLGPGPLLTESLIRLEAVSSSQIEDIDVDVEQLLIRHEQPVGDDGAETSDTEDDAALVARNIEMVADAILRTSTVTEAWLLDLHRNLLANDDIDRWHVGAWRDCPVWIGPTRATAWFEGPPHEAVAGLMTDLVGFCHRYDLDAVTQAAIAHAQFETIHPFVDGNGRVGRALVHPLLRRSAPTVIVPAAHALLASRERYFAGLKAYRDGDLDGWIELFADAVARAAEAAIVITTRLRDLVKAWDDLIRTHRDGTARAILGDLATRPVVTVSTARRRTGVSQPAAHAAIKRLESAGVLRRATVDTPGRHHVWVASGVLDAYRAADALLGPRSS